MRSRASLSVLEQLIMLLIFALAAAICLRAFAWADVASERSAACDRAMREAQNAAAVIRQTRGNMADAAELWGGSVRDGSWVIGYDESWNRADGTSCLLKVTPIDDGIGLLGQAAVSVERNGQQLAALEVAWQEVAADGT